MGAASEQKRFRERAAVWLDRPGLLKGIRRLVHIAVLALTGRTEDLRDCLAWSLERRVPLAKIRETILQTFLFAGYPRALHAFETLEEVLVERGGGEAPKRDRVPPRVHVGKFYQRRGRELFEEIYGGDADLVSVRIRGFQPEFMDWILADAYGKVLSRPFLDVKTRELIAVALLTVLELPRQLTPHIRGALRAGAAVREVSETIRQLELVVPKSVVKMALVRLERARTTL